MNPSKAWNAKLEAPRVFFWLSKNLYSQCNKLCLLDIPDSNKSGIHNMKIIIFHFATLDSGINVAPGITDQKANPNKIYEDDDSTDQVGIPMNPNNEVKNSTSNPPEKITETQSLRETEVIWHIGESCEHRSLLTHPVLDTFVKLKWKMALSLYIRRIRFFWLFAVILTSEIFDQYENEASTCDGGCAWKKILFIILPMLFLIVNVFYQFLKLKVTWERFKRYLFDWSLILISLLYILVSSINDVKKEIIEEQLLAVNTTSLHHIHDQPQNLSQAENSTVVELQNSHDSEIGMHILIQVWFMNLGRFVSTAFGGKFAWQGHWIMEILMMISGNLFTLDFK